MHNHHFAHWWTQPKPKLVYFSSHANGQFFSTCFFSSIFVVDASCSDCICIMLNGLHAWKCLQWFFTLQALVDILCSHNHIMQLIAVYQKRLSLLRQTICSTKLEMDEPFKQWIFLGFHCKILGRINYISIMRMPE